MCLLYVMRRVFHYPKSVDLKSVSVVSFIQLADG